MGIRTGCATRIDGLVDWQLAGAGEASDKDERNALSADVLATTARIRWFVKWA
jgi:hypothetical protein